MAWGIPIIEDIPIVRDVVHAGEEAVTVIVDTMVDTASSIGDLFVDGAVSFGKAASNLGEAAGDLGEAVVLEIEVIGGRVIQTIDDGFEGLSRDITDTAEGMEWLANRAFEEAEKAAEVTVEVVVDAAEVAAETAIDVGMWTWEATTYVQEKAAGAGSDLVDLGGALTGEVLHPMLDPILGENTTNDLIKAGVDFGQIYATGGQAGVRDFVNQQVAAEAGGLERRMVAEALGEDAGVAAGTVTHYGLLRAQGMDPMQAAQQVGMDPTSDAAALVEEGTRELIGDDGAAAAGQFARDLMTTYGQQASDISNRSGLEQYGDRFDSSNPGAAMTRHDPGWVTSRGEVEMLTQSGERAAGEVTEAFFEPIVGQDAAEAMGEYGPRIGMEVFRTIATGGMSGGEAALLAGRTGFEVATGEPFESFIGDRVSTEFAGVLGEDGAAMFGKLTETGLRLGLNYAGSHAKGDLPDQQITDIDLDDFKEAMLDFGVDQFRDLTGVDPNVANRLFLHVGNDNWTDEDSRDLVTTFRPFVPEDTRDIYDAFSAAANDDPNGALNVLRGRLPEPIRDAFDQQQATTVGMTSVLGYDPNAGSSVLDRMGVTTEQLDGLLAQGEEDRGVTPYDMLDTSPSSSVGGVESAFESLTAGLNVDPTDPAAPLVAQAVALQDTIGLLTAQGGPGAAVAIGQAHAMLADLDHQVELLHDTAPVAASATSELVAQQQMMGAAAESLQALAGQGGQAAIAAQQAQALITQAERAFIENAGDPEAVVATQQQLLGAAMAVVQSASVGAPFAQAGAISAVSQQTAGLLASALGHTAGAHGLGPPPPSPQDTSLAAQTEAMAQASQVLSTLAGSPMAAASARQAQALIAQAQAAAADPNADPDDVVVAQQTALGQASAVLQGAAVQSAAMGDGPAAAASQQAAALLGAAQNQTAAAHGVVPPPPDPYAIIAGQNATLQGTLAALSAQAAVTDPQAAMAAQQALGMVGQTQGRMTQVQEELSELQARAALEVPDPVAQARETQAQEIEARMHDLDADALAAARAQAQIPSAEEAEDLRAVAHAPGVVSDDLQEAMAAQHQAVTATLGGMQIQGPMAAAASLQAQAALAGVEAQIASAAQAGRAIAPDAALALREHALDQALQVVAATGTPGAAAAAQLQALKAQTQEATAQIQATPDVDPRAQAMDSVISGTSEGQRHATVDNELQQAMAAQHQAVTQSLQALMGQGPAGAMASQQAQGALLTAQAQITAAAAQNPTTFTPEQALAIQQQALGQALQAVASSGAPGAGPAIGQLQTLMGQTQQAADQMAANVQAAAEVQRRSEPDTQADAELQHRAEPAAAAELQGRPAADPRAAAHAQAETQADAELQGRPAADTEQRDADDDFDEDILAGSAHQLRPRPAADTKADVDAQAEHQLRPAADTKANTEQQGDDDFDDDILTPHITPPGPAAQAQQSEVLAGLDPDGDGQINSGIAAPQAAAANDPLGDLDWQDAGGDALMGEQVVVANEPALAPQPPPAPVVEVPEPAAPMDTPEAPPVPAPAPVAEVPEPEVPVEVPDAPPEPEVIEEAPPAPDPEPPPDTQDDADWQG